MLKVVGIKTFETTILLLNNFTEKHKNTGIILSSSPLFINVTFSLTTNACNAIDDNCLRSALDRRRKQFNNAMQSGAFKGRFICLRNEINSKLAGETAKRQTLFSALHSWRLISKLNETRYIE